ncbi:MAG: phosphatidylglycerophosphatase A [Gammaproteobacteria bacterium]|nr:phosphatidylglycerophosphatase A [Gammaproteobacteria bacterium]
MKVSIDSAAARLLKDPAHLLALGLGSGCLRPAPGTWGSLVGLLLYLPLSIVPKPMFWTIVVAGFGIGVWLCRRTARALGVDDHPAIVWDEVIGIWLTMGLVPATMPWLMAGFALFRLLDIWKPWPIREVDRNLHGGLGIMADDALAGLAGMAILGLIHYIY